MSAVPISAAPTVISLGRLSDDENRIVRGLIEQLNAVQQHNTLVEAYYDGKKRIQDLGIAIPPHLRSIETVVGWPGTTVDVLEERLDIDGWTVPGVDVESLGIDQVAEDNQLVTETSEGHLDALIYGVTFVTVGSGVDGEPSPLITVESPRWMTATWNRRSRRIDAALSVVWGDNGMPRAATVYLDGQTVRVEANGIGQWRVVDRDEHGLAPPVRQLVNRPRRSDPWGRSEITRAVRSYTDNAVRTVLGMEVAREFFSAPQRWVMGASETSFQDAQGNPKTAWETYLGRVLALTKDEDGDKPEVGQFAASSPAPYLEQIRGLARLLAAEAAIPEAYLGVQDQNPSSADAIRSLEARLVKRAERRQRTFGAVWGSVMRLALQFANDGEDVGVTPRPIWRDPSTPTMAAAADRAQKLVEAEILPPDSEVTLEQVGLNETDRERVMADRRRARSDQRLQLLARASDNARRDVAVAELTDRRDPTDSDS